MNLSIEALSGYALDEIFHIFQESGKAKYIGGEMSRYGDVIEFDTSESASLFIDLVIIRFSSNVRATSLNDLKTLYAFAVNVNGSYVKLSDAGGVRSVFIDLTNTMKILSVAKMQSNNMAITMAVINSIKKAFICIGIPDSIIDSIEITNTNYSANIGDLKSVELDLTNKISILIIGIIESILRMKANVLSKRELLDRVIKCFIQITSVKNDDIDFSLISRYVVRIVMEKIQNDRISTSG